MKLRLHYLERLDQKCLFCGLKGQDFTDLDLWTDLDYSPENARANEAVLCNKRSHDYTILLRYPDYINDSDGETYLAHVTAPNVAAAQLLGQLDAKLANEQIVDDHHDFLVLSVFEGHLTDLKEAD